MDDKTLTCGKCKTLLEINAAHVTFTGGKKAYIRCGKCNSVRRIAYDVVKHLSVKPETTEIKADEHGLTENALKEQPVKSPTAEPELVKPETTEKEQETNAPEGVIWGAIAAVLAIIITIAGVLYYSRKNRKEGAAT